MFSEYFTFLPRILFFSLCVDFDISCALCKPTWECHSVPMPLHPALSSSLEVTTYFVSLLPTWQLCQLQTPGLSFQGHIINRSLPGLSFLICDAKHRQPGHKERTVSGTEQIINMFKWFESKFSQGGSEESLKMTAWESFLGSLVEGRISFKGTGFQLSFLNWAKCQHYPFMLFLQTGKTEAVRMLPDHWCDVGFSVIAKGTGRKLWIMRSKSLLCISSH